MPRERTLSVVCRAIAACLLILAFVPWRARRDPGVVIIVLDGASMSELKDLATHGLVPSISKVLARSRVNPISGATADTRAFWREVLSVGSQSADQPSYLWSEAAAQGLSFAIVGVPETSELVTPAEIIAPGADEATGFVGDNVGVLLDPSANIAALRWPYDGVLPEAASAIANLRTGAASDWIFLQSPGENARSGAFRIYKLADGWTWISPVYRSVRDVRTYVPDAPEGLWYVADDPAWLPAVDISPDYYLAQEKDLADVRAQVAASCASGERKVVLYFDSSIALVRAAYSHGGHERVDDTVIREAYAAVDARVGMIVRAAGAPTSVALLGYAGRAGSQDTPAASNPEGFMAIAGPAVTANSTNAESMSPSAVTESLIFGLLGQRARSATQDGRDTPGVPLSVSALRELGFLPASSTESSATEGDSTGAATASSPPAR